MRRTLALLALLGFGAVGLGAAIHSRQVVPYGLKIAGPAMAAALESTGAYSTPSATWTPVGALNYPTTDWPQWSGANIATQRLDGRNPAAHIASWSSAAIAFYNAHGTDLTRGTAVGGMGSWSSYAPLRINSPGDGGMNTYVGKLTDPIVTIHCVGYGDSPLPVGNHSGCPSLDGLSIHIPANAKAECDRGNATTCTKYHDAHMLVIDPAGQYTYEMYQASNVLSTGNITSGQRFITATSTGWSRGWNSPEGGAVNEALVSAVAGEVTGADLVQGSINHAILFAVPCLRPDLAVYPTAATAGDSNCGTGHGPPLGARLWLNMTDAQIDAVGLDPIRTMVAKALAHYGGFVNDSTGTSAIMIRRSGAASGQGATDWQAAVNKYGSALTGGSWMAENWPTSISNNFAWLDPCISVPAGQTIGGQTGC
jgi:hypothetical protein